MASSRRPNAGSSSPSPPPPAPPMNMWLPPSPPPLSTQGSANGSSMGSNNGGSPLPRIRSKEEINAKRAAVHSSKQLPKLKIMVQGLHQCGATSLVNRYCLHLSSDPLYSTLSVDFKSKDVLLQGKTYSAQFWEAPGMESRRHMGTVFYKFMHGFVVCYDSTDKRSFDDVRAYYANAIEVFAVVPDVPVVLVATKCDDVTKREVDPEEGQMLAEGLGWHFFETSARNNTNVDAAFEAVLAQAAKVQLPSKEAAPPKTIWQMLWDGLFFCCMSPAEDHHHQHSQQDYCYDNYEGQLHGQQQQQQQQHGSPRQKA